MFCARSTRASRCRCSPRTTDAIDRTAVDAIDHEEAGGQGSGARRWRRAAAGSISAAPALASVGDVSPAASGPSAAPTPGHPGQKTRCRTDFRPVVFWLASLPTDAERSRDDDRDAARLAHHLPHHGHRRRSAIALRLGRARGSRDEASDAAAGVSALHGVSDRASFGAVVTNTRAAPGRGRDDSQSGSRVAAILGRTDAHVAIAPGECVPVRFDASATSTGRVRVQMTVTIGSETDSFEPPLPVTAATEIDTRRRLRRHHVAIDRKTAPSGAGWGRRPECLALLNGARRPHGKREYLYEYPYECAEQKASRALALVLASDLNGRSVTGASNRRNSAPQRARAGRAGRLPVSRRRLRDVAGRDRCRLRT